MKSDKKGKAEYIKPCLMVHGSVEKLTGKMGNGTKDGYQGNGWGPS